MLSSSLVPRPSHVFQMLKNMGRLLNRDVYLMLQCE